MKYLKALWAFCSYLFWPQSRPKDAKQEGGITELRKYGMATNGNPFMKRRNVGIANRESLLEGCYHEMGHVLATLHYFPDEERIENISFAQKLSGGFGFDTNSHKVSWSLPTQKDSFIMCCIGGGIFQQMKTKYGELKKHSEFDQWPVDALRGFFSQYIKCPIEGMEVDMAYLNRVYSELLKRKPDIEPLNLDEEKEKAIDLFMPYLENKKIDRICEHIVDKIMENWGVCDTFIGIKEIREYLGM